MKWRHRGQGSPSEFCERSGDIRPSEAKLSGTQFQGVPGKSILRDRDGGTLVNRAASQPSLPCRGPKTLMRS
jgi:hypothetical protein